MQYIPAHLPPKLTITMWDFSWYTMTMPGEPYHDLSVCFDEAIERGYNTIRICAMPFMLFTDQGKRSGKLHIGSLAPIGQRSRWYNGTGGAVLDGHAHLLELFRQAKLHHCYIILSSWEYQQSPSFLESPLLADLLNGVPAEERFLTVAKSMSRLIDFLKAEGYQEQIAYTELHNEIEFGRLTKIAELQNISSDRIADQIRYMTPYVSEAIDLLRTEHPDILMTGCYTINEAYPKSYLPDNFQVAHFHLYLKGVLQQLMEATGIADETIPFPNELVKHLLRHDAPPFTEWQLPEEQIWKMEGNPVGMKMLYLHDWADPDQWDLYLYDHYKDHKLAMLQKAETRLEEVNQWAKDHQIPVVIGEGYIGYTPLYAQFEEGPVGKYIAEYAVHLGIRMGFWGMVLCSNCAPHHPFWQDITWQQKMNRCILDSSKDHIE